MINFGYSIAKDRQIDFDNNDKRVADFVLKNEPTFNVCIVCGTCSATCSAANFTDFNPQKLYVLIRRGEMKNAKQEISKCMMCGKCQVACPRGVNTRNVILNIKRALEM